MAERLRAVLVRVDDRVGAAGSVPVAGSAQLRGCVQCGRAVCVVCACAEGSLAAFLEVHRAPAG